MNLMREYEIRKGTRQWMDLEEVASGEPSESSPAELLYYTVPADS